MPRCRHTEVLAVEIKQYAEEGRYQTLVPFRVSATGLRT